MRFTKEQYEAAIKDLQDGLTQLEPNGHGCHICGDSGHQAFECGSNPLYAIACCLGVVKSARELHERVHELEERPLTQATLKQHQEDCSKLHEDIHMFLHYLGGDMTRMGETFGPAKVKPLDPPELPKGTDK